MARDSFLPFSPPCLSEAEIEAVVAVLREGTWLSSGPKTKEFEEKFKAKVGAQAALALNSCTAGLQLAMALFNVGPEDEVITTPITFCATANVIEHERGRVVLADVDPETLLIDPKEIEKRISKRTKAIIPVHYTGQPCDMDAIESLAKPKGIHVVEDAAHCMPSKIGDKWIGSSSNLTFFSFYATKNMTSGEGGMMTGPASLVDEARSLALHGLSRGAWDRYGKGGTWKYDVARPGFKFNLPEMSSVLGMVQLGRLDELHARRMALVNFYDRAFAQSKFLSPIRVRAGVTSGHHLYVVQLNLDTFKIDRDRFIEEMKERNIACSVHFIPVHLFSFYAKKYGWKPESFPNAYNAFQRIVSLPLSPKLTVDDAADVVEAVEDICGKFAR